MTGVFPEQAFALMVSRFAKVAPDSPLKQQMEYSLVTLGERYTLAAKFAEDNFFVRRYIEGKEAFRATLLKARGVAEANVVLPGVTQGAIAEAKQVVADTQSAIDSLDQHFPDAPTPSSTAMDSTVGGANMSAVQQVHAVVDMKALGVDGLPSFTNQPTKLHPRDFIRKLDSARAMNNISDRAMAEVAARLCKDGTTAGEFVKRLHNENKPALESYVLFKQAFEDRFQSKPTVALKKEVKQTLKQKDEEDGLDFLDRCVNASYIIYDSPAMSEVRETLALDMFQEGAKEYLQRKIVALQTLTRAEVVRVINSAEVQRSVPAADGGFEVTAVQSSGSRGGSGRGRGGRGGRGGQTAPNRGEDVCLYCHKVGHWAKECRGKKSDQAQGIFQRSRPLPGQAQQQQQQVQPSQQPSGRGQPRGRGFQSYPPRGRGRGFSSGPPSGQQWRGGYNARGRGGYQYANAVQVEHPEAGADGSYQQDEAAYEEYAAGSASSTNGYLENGTDLSVESLAIKRI